MNLNEKRQWAVNKSLDEVLNEREKYECGTPDWLQWNEVKADLLESIKPSTKEEIVYFDSEELLSIPPGLSSATSLPQLTVETGRRSELEYNPTQRHPIPYVIVKHKKYYFFILREKGSGELRLIGKKGLLGGHVGAEDVDPLSLNKTLLNALRRELKEEAGITESMIHLIELKGLLKSDEGVDADHLGCIYQIELTTKDIHSHEEDVLSGIWIHEKDLADHAPMFESWARILYDQGLLKP